MLNIIEPVNQIYVINIANADSEIPLYQINKWNVIEEIYTDYETATRRLLYLANERNESRSIWLKVYKTISDKYSEYCDGGLYCQGTYYYSIYGQNKINTKFSPYLSKSQFEKMSPINCSIINHYIPKDKEKVYKKLKLESKLDK